MDTKINKAGTLERSCRSSPGPGLVTVLEALALVLLPGRDFAILEEMRGIHPQPWGMPATVTALPRARGLTPVPCHLPGPPCAWSHLITRIAGRMLPRPVPGRACIVPDIFEAR